MWVPTEKEALMKHRVCIQLQISRCGFFLSFSEKDRVLRIMPTQTVKVSVYISIRPSICLVNFSQQSKE